MTGGLWDRAQEAWWELGSAVWNIHSQNLSVAWLEGKRQSEKSREKGYNLAPRWSEMFTWFQTRDLYFCFRAGMNPPCALWLIYSWCAAFAGENNVQICWTIQLGSPHLRKLKLRGHISPLLSSNKVIVLGQATPVEKRWVLWENVISLLEWSSMKMSRLESSSGYREVYGSRKSAIVSRYFCSTRSEIESLRGGSEWNRGIVERLLCGVVGRQPACLSLINSLKMVCSPANFQAHTSEM